MCKIRIRLQYLVFSFSSTPSVRTNRFHAITLTFPGNIGPAKCEEQIALQTTRGPRRAYTTHQLAPIHRSTFVGKGFGFVSVVTLEKIAWQKNQFSYLPKQFYKATEGCSLKMYKV